MGERRWAIGLVAAALVACGGTGNGGPDAAGDEGPGTDPGGDAAILDAGTDPGNADPGNADPGPGDPGTDIGPQAFVMAGAGKANIDPTFEVYTDTNGNGRWDVGEPIQDENDNGKLDTLWLGGFGPRQPTGWHDPLEARTVVLRLDGQDYVFTALDTLGFGMKRVDDVRAAVAAALGARAPASERMFIASIHTHQAPDTIGVFAPNGKPGWDEAYLQHVVAGAVDSILAAYDDLRPARLRVAAADGEGLARDIVEPIVLDPYVGILQAVAADGDAPIATMVAVANHPEAAWSKNTLVSADFPHYLRAKVEDAIGGMAIYFSADLGLMQTPVADVEEGFARAQAVGETYADRVLAALDDAPLLDDADVSPTFRFARVPVTLQNVGLAAAVMADFADGYKDYLYMLDDGGPCSTDYGLGCVDIPLPVLRLGAKTTVFCVPAEITPELVVGGIVAPTTYESRFPDAPPEPILGERIATPDRFLIGLCGGDVGYLFPKITYNMEAVFDQQNGPGADAAGTYLAGLIDVLEQVNEAADAAGGE